MSEEHKAQWIVLDRHENAWGPFDAAHEAGMWALRKWPNRPFDPVPWCVAALRSPDEL